MDWWNIPELRQLLPEADQTALMQRQLALLEFMLRR